MMTKNDQLNRRDFFKKSSMVAIGTGSLLAFPNLLSAQPTTAVNDINIVGPKDGFTTQIGTLVSMMNWMRNVILNPVRDLSIEELDYLVDDEANSIGAMLWHLAATERFYQIHTFEDKKWGDWSKEDDENFSVAMGLGDKARDLIKGHPLEFYMEKLDSVREHTLAEFAKRDDEWLMKVDNDFPWGPTNNYCKWFHVCEHESNHNGQFKFIRKRLPTRKG